MLARKFSSRTARPLALTAAGALVAVGLFAAPADAATPQTTTSPAKAAAGWLAQQFTNHFDYAGSTFFDGGTTADAIFALSAAGVGKDKIDSAMTYFARHVDDYTSLHDKSGKPGPFDGSVAKTAVAALVAGVDPTHFGGYNLLHALKHDQCTAASQPKNSKDTTTPVCPAAGAARNIYSSVSESLAILAEARGAAKYGSTFAPDGPALSYFLSLQCANGGFTVDTAGGAHCVGDPDATGYAMMALQAAGHQSAALDRAAQWLKKIRNADGSWTAQHVHNVDSTGLAAAALRAHGVATGRSAAWLASQQVKTGPTVGAGATRGALKYNGAFDAASSVKATADGILGMVGHGSLATLSDASAASGTPVLALQPGTVQHKRVVAGRAQTVSATGFAAHETVGGVLHPGGRSVGSARADKNGSVTLTFTVPRSATGTRSVVLTGARSGLRTGTASFHIAEASSPASGVPAGPPTTATGEPSLADTGRDSRQTVLELAVGLGLIVTGALAVVIGRRRAE